MVASPEQCERWSDLMPLITWELWLTREVVKDSPLPWQKQQTRLSPGQVFQGMQNILVAIGMPARVCKSRGKSPGRPTRRPRSHRERFDLVRSEQWKTIRARKKTQKTGQEVKKASQRK